MVLEMLLQPTERTAQECGSSAHVCMHQESVQEASRGITNLRRRDWGSYLQAQDVLAAAPLAQPVEEVLKHLGWARQPLVGQVVQVACCVVLVPPASPQNIPDSDLCFFTNQPVY